MRNTTKFVHKYTLNSLHSSHVRLGCKIPKRMHTRLHAGRSGICTLSGTKSFFFSKKFRPALGPSQPQWESGALPRTQSDRWLILTTQLHLAQRIRMSGAIHLFLLYILLLWRGTPLPFHFPNTSTTELSS